MNNNLFQRKKTRQIKIRDMHIGGNAPISVQSMTNTKTHDVQKTLKQIEQLNTAGCDIIRLAIPDNQALSGFSSIRQQTNTPLVADIHFNYKLAIGAIEAGADKIRINPGNIGSQKQVFEIIDAAKLSHVPIRIGVNSGSVEKHLLQKHGGPTPEALVESALGFISFFEYRHFYSLVVSIKASDVYTTIQACRLLSQHTDIAQHIGITESGTVRSGTIRSSVGLGILLSEGIGDTIRVSLCGDPIHEVYTAQEILKSLNLLQGPHLIACPTCGRTDIDIENLAIQVEQLVQKIRTPLTIAVMGCVVNGPGEAAEADIGIAGGKNDAIIFIKGKPIERVGQEQLLDKLWEYIQKLISEKETNFPH